MSNRNRSRRRPRPSSPPVPIPDVEPEPPDSAVVVGRVIRPHGSDGTLRVQPHSDNPARFQVGGSLTVAGNTRTISEFRPLPGGYALLRLDGVEDVDAVRSLGGQWLVAPVETAPDLPPGEYYHYQLVGLNVVTDEGENLGTLREVLVTGGNDVYVVTSDTGKEILLPAVAHVVQDVDLSLGRVLVHLIDGLR